MKDEQSHLENWQLFFYGALTGGFLATAACMASIAVYTRSIDERNDKPKEPHRDD